MSPESVRFERAVLAYSPMWMAVVATCMGSGVLERWGDREHLALGVGIALPVLAMPLVLRGGYTARAVAYLAVTTLVQMLIGSMLFFDRLGMEYHFHTTWSWNRSPVFLYPMTLGYFATYYVVMQLVLRKLGLSRPGVRRTLAIAGLSYAVAFAETAFMATPAMATYFVYRDKAFMLCWGSVCYGTVFFATLPGFLRLDEPRSGAQVVRDALLGNAVALGCYGLYALVLPYLGRP